ncbi:hypothetical protein MCOR23_011704 [Pyricularia oryzae]|nr:hypothetical protein MCOR23_011704 [Pyricularia oryzae]
MTIKHIVLFQFKADASPEAIQEVCSSMVALKDKCLHPESQAPYIKSMSGGKDNSPENLQRPEWSGGSRGRGYLAALLWIL